MDRSYPYSRRQVSRARLRKRAAAVAAVGLAGAAALFMPAWEADTLTAPPAPADRALPALAGSALDGRPHGVRRIYPYSVVPGGVAGKAELARVIRTDRVVATHYASFNVGKARPVVVDKPRAVHVSYRKGDKVYWTARKVRLAEGETLLSDGRNEMRARCANRISDVPQYPVEAHQPAMDELDDAVEIDEGEQYALGPDGLPVSIDPATGMPRQAGQRFALHAGSGATPSGGPADMLLAGGSDRAYTPGTASPGVITTMGLSGTSSSTSSRPRPVSGTPASSTGSAASSDGSAGTPGRPAPSGGASAAVPVPDTGGPARSPLPDTLPALSPAQTPPASTAPAPDPAPLPAPMPALLPGIASSPASAPMPGPRPGGQQYGDGTGEPPATPGKGPPFPLPDTGTEPFIPKPELMPRLEIGAGQPAAPADVPEPGSLWLAGAGLTALWALRRRRPRRANGL